MYIRVGPHPLFPAITTTTPPPLLPRFRWTTLITNESRPGSKLSVCTNELSLRTSGKGVGSRRRCVPSPPPSPYRIFSHHRERIGDTSVLKPESWEINNEKSNKIKSGIKLDELKMHLIKKNERGVRSRSLAPCCQIARNFPQVEN